MTGVQVAIVVNVLFFAIGFLSGVYNERRASGRLTGKRRE